MDRTEYLTQKANKHYLNAVHELCTAWDALSSLPGNDDTELDEILERLDALAATSAYLDGEASHAIILAG